jgi:DNA modification methylase
MQYLQSEKVDDSWSFREINRSETSYLTHSYHRYPAKFIPQLAARLIKENSQVGELVCDPFMGSGTTLVEAIVNHRRAYGTDINPVAVLITRAKTTPIEPRYLETKILLLKGKIKQRHLMDEGKQTLLIKDDLRSIALENKRIDYWFPEKQKHDLSIILSAIMGIEDNNIRNFLLCAFSNILKGCSRWMMKSVKPTIDKNKVINNVYSSFFVHTQRMLQRNRLFWKTLERKKKVECTIDNVDARKMKINNDSVALIVTSPPYVTSYEYADLHQLTAIWLGYAEKLSDFRTNFIGSIQKAHRQDKLYSELGRTIVDKLKMIDRRESNGVEQYFFEMQQCFEQMYRVLKHGGRASIVIGDTALKKVKIYNADVFLQTMQRIGFKIYNTIKRPIPSKILPLTRDEKTGRFVGTTKADRLAYPLEYILIMEKV